MRGTRSEVHKRLAKALQDKRLDTSIVPLYKKKINYANSSVQLYYALALRYDDLRRTW
jgi:hypothetical protein